MDQEIDLSADSDRPHPNPQQNQQLNNPQHKREEGFDDIDGSIGSDGGDVIPDMNQRLNQNRDNDQANKSAFAQEAIQAQFE